MPGDEIIRGVFATARGWDLAFGMLFAALGASLAAAGWRMPAGVGGIPGPGFFPMLIGGAMTVLGSTLAAQARTAHGEYWPGGLRHPPLRQAAGIVLLLAAYTALWEVVPFAIRTPLLLLAIARLAGDGWRRAAIGAVVTTLVLAAAFDLLLRVRL